MAKLLDPVVLGDDIPLHNRICMGSMTRNRCTDANKPTEASVKSQDRPHYHRGNIHSSPCTAPNGHAYTFRGDQHFRQFIPTVSVCLTSAS